MVTVKITLEVEIPDVGATEEQICNWIRYSLHEIGGLDNENPLCVYDLEAKFGTVDIQ